MLKIAKDKGIAGGALEATDVLPKNGRMFFPVKGNLAFKKDGWCGSVSVWCNTDPDKLIKTKFCDPVQITQKGDDNGGAVVRLQRREAARDLRHGAFPAVPDGQKADRRGRPEGADGPRAEASAGRRATGTTSC